MPLPDNFFASATVHDRKVKMPNGEEHTVYFKEITAPEVRAYQLAEQSDNDDERAGAIVRLIAASVCEPDGKRSLSIEQAAQLRPQAAARLLERVLEVNQMGIDAVKKTSPSGESAGSGTS